MPRPAGSAGAPPPGLLGMYSLAVMEKEGRTHGYGIAERIAERTEGAWRPGAGAIYPSLQKLVVRGWARARITGRRRDYEITPEGRRFLLRIRQRQASMGASRLDVTVLWAEIAGSEDLDSFLLSRLRRALDAVGQRLDRMERPIPGGGELREDAVRELRRSLARLERPRAHRNPTRTAPRRVAG
jgi:PadR family transcriptional regulator, regulatory protein PadR